MAGLQDGGVYHIVNHKTGTTIDISGGDGRSVSGWTLGDGENQKFRIQSTGDGKFTLQNIRGQYLAIEGSPENGVAVIGSDSPFGFDIQPDPDFEGRYKIWVPGSKHVVDLSDHGNPEPGTAVTLWYHWVAPNQAWEFRTLG